MSKAINFMIIGILLGMIVGFFIGNTSQLNGEKTDCYDKLGNKIIGQECIKENWVDTRTESIIYSILIASALIGAFGLFIGGMEDIRREMK